MFVRLLYAISLIFLLSGCFLQSDFKVDSSIQIGPNQQSGASSFGAFEETLYPVLQNQCGACHGTFQQPQFALPQKQDAFNIILDNQLVDLNQPKNSRIYQKILGGHQNFQASVSDSLLLAIENWAIKLGLEIDPSEPDKEDGFAFEVSSGDSILFKVKNLLVGEPVSNDEYSQTIKIGGNGLPTADAQILSDLVDQWLQSPEFESKMIQFFNKALQQEFSFGTDTDNMWGRVRDNRFRQNVIESMSRTALRIISEDRPFSEIANTNEFEVTTALLTALAWMDNPQGPIRSNNDRNRYRDFLATLTDADFNDWKTVIINRAPDINSAARFDDLANWRAISDGDSIAFGLERVGFFTSLGFQAKWVSNIDNQFRLTINQVLLTALNDTFRPSDKTSQTFNFGIDEDHSAVGSSCYECHRLMDPMKEIFKFNNSYRYRFIDKGPALRAAFTFQGTSAEISSLQDLGNMVAGHPNFALAWSQKLCDYFNTYECDYNDVQFQKVVSDFKDSNLNLKTLIKSLVLSPIITGSEETVTSTNNKFRYTFVRQTQFCHNLNLKIRSLQSAQGQPLSPIDNGNSICQGTNIRRYISSIPDDEIVRGLPGFTNNYANSPFTSQAIELVCTEFASRLVRNMGLLPFNNATNQTNSFDLITQIVAGIPPSHNRYTAIRNAVANVFNYSINTEGFNTRDAMIESTILACQSADFWTGGL